MIYKGVELFDVVPTGIKGFSQKLDITLPPNKSPIKTKASDIQRL